MDAADQAQAKDRDDRSFGRDRNRDSDETDTDRRARLLQPALMSTRLQGAMRALETGTEIVTIQTDIAMGVGTVAVAAHAGHRSIRGRDRYYARAGRDCDRGHDPRMRGGRRASVVGPQG